MSFWWIFTWLRRDLRVACCLGRQQVGAGRGSYEVVAGAQGKGGQNMAIWRQSRGKTQRKMTSKLESPFETNHIEFVAPGLFQHFAVWRCLKCFSMKIGWYLNPASCASQLSLQLNELLKMSQKCCYFWLGATMKVKWKEMSMQMAMKVPQRYVFVVPIPMELGCCHDRSWIDQLGDALLWPRVLQLRRYHARLRREESMCVIYSFVLYLIWARES